MLRAYLRGKSGAFARLAVPGSGSARSGRGGRGAKRLPPSGHEVRDVRQPDLASEAREHVAEVLDRVHADELTAAEDRERDRGALATRVGSGEEKIFLVSAARTWRRSTIPLSIGITPSSMK